MIENKEMDRGGDAQRPKNDDAVIVFCFSNQPEMHKAHDVITRNAGRHWAEKRKAEKGVMYPYWVACRADRRGELEDVLNNAGIRWDDVESHYYSAIQDQSTGKISTGHPAEYNQQSGKTPSIKSPGKTWWQFWK